MKGSKNLVRTVSHINVTIGKRIGQRWKRSLQVTAAACLANSVIAIGKLVIGIFSLSLFTCINALYTFGMVIAKGCALAGVYKAKNKKEQYRYYSLSGVVLITVSVLYIAYSVRLFFYPVSSSYHMYIGIGIATFTFTELTLNIRGVIIERHNHTPLIHAVKMINLASSLICLVLTQTALLSFAGTGVVENYSHVNGIMGVIMGSLATLLGIIMVVRIGRIRDGKNYGAVYRKIKKLMKKQGILLPIKPVLYIEHVNETRTLYVKFLCEPPQHILQSLQSLVEEELGYILLDVSVMQQLTV